MRVNCRIDGVAYSINANSDKPLHRILMDMFPSFASNNSCKGAGCGNCIVLIDNQCVLSCLVPACRLEGKEIVTFEAFSKTRAYHDIEKAYSDSGSTPCPQCYASKTLLIESLVNKLEKLQKTSLISGKKPMLKNNKSILSRNFVKHEISVNRCSCVETAKLETIVILAYQNRRRRSGGNS